MLGFIFSFFERCKSIILALAVCILLMLAFTYNYFTNLEQSKLHYKDLSKQQSQHVVDKIDATMRDIYQGLRTIARLPSVRNIDRYAENLDDDTDEAIQEIYNNLNTQVRMSEVYIVPASFNPEIFDPNTGKLESTIISYDHFVAGKLSADVPDHLSDQLNIEEIEIFEYRAMVDQINWYKQYYPLETQIDGFDYPALSSPEVVTCDNSEYSPFDPDDNKRSGLVYSLPFFDLQGELKGIVSGVVLSEIMRSLLPNANFSLQNSNYGYEITKKAKPSLGNTHSSESSEERLYTESFSINDNDARGSWSLIVSQPDSEFWDNLDVIGLQSFTLMGYGFSILFSIFLYITLKLSNRYKDIYHKNPTILFTLSPCGEILTSNEFGALKLGYSPIKLEGTNIKNLLKTPDVINFEQIFEDFNEAAPKLPDCEFIDQEGQVLWLKLSIRVITRGLKEKVGLLVGEDITEACELRHQLEERANNDWTTGLLNRWGFEARCSELIQNNKDAFESHTLVFLDLDDFKVVNDTSGHAAGDELLKQLGYIFKGITRSKDIIGRLGGDEFGILFVDCDEKVALQKAQQLVDAVRDFEFTWQDTRFSIGVSIGIVVAAEKFENFKSLLFAADCACYMAKNLGRSRYHLYCEADIKLEKRHDDMQWRSKIENAIVEDGFTLMFQPIVSLKDDDKVPHFEILLRYTEENGDLTAPFAFLPVAEKYGIMVKLDYWVVEKTIHWLQKNMTTNYLCSINLSGRSVSNQQFLVKLIELICNSGIEPSNICFEITETAVMNNVDHAINFVEQLKRIGCKFSLDDFGSGLSSFAYLKSFRVDYLKIDGQFVKDLNVDKLDYAMVHAIADIGRSFSIKTIAEFVEDQAIVDKLKELQVDYAQGYHYGRPKPLDQMFD